MNSSLPETLLEPGSLDKSFSSPLVSCLRDKDLDHDIVKHKGVHALYLRGNNPVNDRLLYLVLDMRSKSNLNFKIYTMGQQLDERIAAKYKINRFPSVLVFKDKEYLGCFCGGISV